MSGALRFETVRVNRMPGFRSAGFPLRDLSPGINVIHGPNGSGKTTSALAIEALLWPRSAVGLRPHVSGSFRLDADEWTVDVDYDRAVHQRNGIVADPPVMPPAEERDRYRLSLHELMGADNARFAEAILKEAAGGYDLAGARESLPSASPLSTRSREFREMREAMAELEAAITRQRELREQERGLEDLLRRKEEATRSARRAEVLRLALAHAEAREAEELASAELSDFPDAMEGMRGDELELLAKIEEELESTDRAMAGAGEKLTAARAAISGSGVHESPVDQALVAALRSDLETLRQLERKLEDCERDRESAAGRLNDARRLLGPDADDDRLAEIDVDALGDLTEVASRAAQARLHVTGLRDRIEVLGREAGPADRAVSSASGFARAETCLHGWLRASAPGASADRATRGAAGAAGALLVAAGLALASTGTIWLLLAAAGAAVLAAVLLPRAPSTDPREHHRREYARLTFDPPEAWEPEAVERRLDQLQQLKAEAQLAEARENARKSLQVELTRAEQELAAADAERADAAILLGVPPETGPAGLVWLAQRVAQWQTASGALAGALGAVTVAAGHVESARANLRSRLSSFAAERPQTAGDFAAAIQRLDDRREQRDAGLRDAAQAEAMLRELGARRDRCRQAVNELYERCGVPAAGRAALEERCDSFSGYLRARKAVDEATFALAHARRALGGAGEDAELLRAAPADLRDQLSAAEEAAAGLQHLAEQITRIRTRVEDAKMLDAIEACNERVERCREALAEARERETRGVLAALLVERVREATETDHLPAVFHRAQKIFTRITHGRYSLAFVSAPEPRFHAFDNQERRGRTLDELSSGTRVQLLLAVRVAFVETQEARARLPLVLDEVLGNSDDERAAAIMDAVIELARDGRQIFYLTAQQDEVAKWRLALEQRNDVEWRLIDLLAARSMQRPLQTHRLRRTAPPAARVPDPDGATHAEYAAALGVPGIDPVTAHPGNLHLWYLVDCPERLHDLLLKGVSHWGELEVLVRHTETMVIDEPGFVRIAALTRAAEAWLESRRVGAGMRVDREALVNADAISPVFLDRAADLSEQLGGDARRLITAIEAGELKRFRNAVQLRDYLQAGGYLDPRDPLPDAEVRARVLGSVAREIERGDVTLSDIDGLIARLDGGAASS